MTNEEVLNRLTEIVFFCTSMGFLFGLTLATVLFLVLS